MTDLSRSLPPQPQEQASLVADPPVLVIEPRTGWSAIKLSEIWEFKDLLRILVERDVRVRYKQTVIGAAWVVIQPLFTMIVFSIVFGRVARIQSDGIPYPLFVFSALVPWQLFSKALSDSTTSIVANRALITKVYFPRLVLPLSSVLGGLVDFGIAFGVLLLMLAYYRVVPSWHVILLPGFVALALASALAVGLWLSAINAKYRDVQYTVPFLLQAWLFLTPIAYPASIVSSKWRAAMALNPMYGVVQGFRWALLGSGVALGPAFWISLGAVVTLLVSGAAYFKRMERQFADVV